MKPAPGAAILGLTFATAGCWLVPAGDAATYVDVLNASESDVVLVIEPASSGQCYALRAGQLGRISSRTGPFERGSAPLVRFYSHGVLAKTLRPSQEFTLFVVDSEEVKDVAVDYEVRDGYLVYDVPAVPEIHGREMPRQLPTDLALCPTK
jgi:hypothetical protein